MSPKTRLVVVLSVVYIDMLGIGLAFPVLPRLIEQFEGGDVSLASYTYGALAAAYSLMQFASLRTPAEPTSRAHRAHPQVSRSPAPRGGA
ncbi:MAG TPA: hypothetical protein VMU03_00300 [Gammaproteobacteria bacterium]|jgi:hypothetical protein|nr:hypothetical protein [Gammaproteobacteria bacterium]